MKITQDMLDIAMLKKVKFYGKGDKANPNVNYDDFDAIKYKDMSTAPTIFHEAWNYPCPWPQKKWSGGSGRSIPK
jgi:hypothetical protein